MIIHGFGKYTTFGPSSTCPYFKKFSLAGVAKTSKNQPSSNRPVECPHCRTVFWSYYTQEHFKDFHKGSLCTFIITDEERQVVINSTDTQINKK